MSNNDEDTNKKAKTESVQAKKLNILNNYEEESLENDADLVNKAENMEISKEEIEVETKKVEVIEKKLDDQKNELPQGFFDDIKKDIQARNLDYNAILDSEFAKFKAELQNEETKNEIIAELDYEVRDVDRDLEEVDQLIENWSRVENLHQRKENLLKTKGNKVVDKGEKSSDDDSDIDLESVLNLTLRTKNRC